MTDFTIKKEEHIKSIIDNFDFIRVKKYMDFVNWQWIGISPDITDLIKNATLLLNDVYDRDVISISTGGFKATKHDDYLELEFIISDWRTEIINYGPEYEKLKKIKLRKRKLRTITQNLQNENY
jgi:hypothetical protein